MMLGLGLWLALVLVLTACGGDDPSEEARAGAELLRVPFDAPGDWEEGAYPVGAAEPDSVLAIEDGRYTIGHRAERSASFTWGQSGDEFADVIIEVETEQLSAHKDNLYGMACRLAPGADGDQTGYVLLISGDGHYGIAALKRRSLDFLLEWHQTGDINQGRATNTIRAVCAGDYLALYVNDTFLGEVRDDTYPRAGQVGLVAGVDEGETVRVAFDNLAVYEATLDD